MAELPFQPQGGDTMSNAPYHVIPDPVRGGWNVYTTHRPQEPQRYFDTKEEAISFAERLSAQESVGFVVEEFEAHQAGRPTRP